MVATRLIVADGDLTVHTHQDVEDIIERNKALASVPQRSDWGRHVASVPVNVINRWLDEEYARGNVDLRWGSKEFMALVARKLADHDWLYLRTDL
jgi:hypothetical protein